MNSDLITKFYDWVANTPNPENLSVTDVLLFALLRELQVLNKYGTTGLFENDKGEVLVEVKPPNFAY